MHSFSTWIKQLSDVWAGLWCLVSEAPQLLQEVAHLLHMLYVRLTKVRIRTGPGESTEKWPTRTRGEGVNKYTNPIYKHRQTRVQRPCGPLPDTFHSISLETGNKPTGRWWWWWFFSNIQCFLSIFRFSCICKDADSKALEILVS